MIRRLLCVLLVVGLLPGTWLRSPIPPADFSQSLTAVQLPLPAGCCSVGPIRIEAAWHLSSPNADFGSYSALVQIAPHRLLAFSDAGKLLDMPEPGTAGSVRIATAIPSGNPRKDNRDVEAASWDPRTGRLWLAMEGRDAVLRLRPDLYREAYHPVSAMRAWPGNKGPEAMVRLRDGRFIVLGESYTGWTERRRHPGLLFKDDPAEGVQPEGFTFVGSPGYRPTDMAALPDGRVLVLMRRLTWPFPARFAARLALADPARIAPGREWTATDLGEIAAPVPIDNYEGLALVPQRDGTVTGWIIADDNRAALERTLLLRLRIDPATLPR